MAIDMVSASSANAMDLTRNETWLERFLTSGCIFSSGPASVWVGWGKVSRSDRPRQSRLSLFAPDFLLQDTEPWRLYEESQEFGIDELLELLAHREVADRTIDWTEPSFQDYAASFEDIQTRIAAFELSKAVPAISRTAKIEVDVELRAQAIRTAIEFAKNSPLLPYGFWNDEEGMIGATPEILFEQTSRRQMETMALAGTRRIDEPGESLLADPKEVFEHHVVVEGIRDRLVPYGEVVATEPEEIRLPALIHLRTEISVYAKADVEFGEWVEALHPTPAIGAWPRESGWNWLRSQSYAVSRCRYGAPFGLIPPGQTSGRCLVAIRNLQWDSEHAWMMAGGGIVGASRLGREWRELNSKLDSVQEALGI